jgi:C4-dicarboxylate-specific signal transduction histidine kinase
VKLGELIEQTLVLARAELRAGGVDVQLDLAADLPPVCVEEIPIQQVLMNLIRNAIDAMVAHAEPGSRTLLIRTRLEARSMVTCELADRGAMLREADIERMFTPFYTTKVEGLGMGLAISRTIIDAHGGRLWGRAGVGRGAIFGFSLPAAGAPSSDV